jgi:hypothetical protein
MIVLILHHHASAHAFDLALTALAQELDRGELLPLAARDPHPAPPAVKKAMPVTAIAAGNWSLDRSSTVTANDSGYEPATQDDERTCSAPTSGAGMTNGISGDRLPQCMSIDSISGALLRTARASAAAESTVDGRGQERGRNARDLGSCEPSLQTALGVHQISGEVGGESEQFAGIKPSVLTMDTPLSAVKDRSGDESGVRTIKDSAGVGVDGDTPVMLRPDYETWQGQGAGLFLRSPKRSSRFESGTPASESKPRGLVGPSTARGVAIYPNHDATQTGDSRERPAQDTTTKSEAGRRGGCTVSREASCVVLPLAGAAVLRGRKTFSLSRPGSDRDKATQPATIGVEGRRRGSARPPQNRLVARRAA